MHTSFKTLLFLSLALLAVNTVTAQTGTAKPVVYLTFDDGPSADSSTDELLDVLARYGAEATFFVTGQRTAKDGEKLSAILYGGHALGNHTYTHARLINESRASIKSEFVRTAEAVLQAGGPPLSCYRAPFGLSDERVVNIGGELGMEEVKWTIDTRDWQPTVARHDIARALSSIEPGSIVLMHDGPAKRAKTIAAFDEWMEENAHRYQFNALPQCKPYGISELFVVNETQEIDRPLEEETIQSMLEKLRSYRFSLDVEGTEGQSAPSFFKKKLAARTF